MIQKILQATAQLHSKIDNMLFISHQAYYMIEDNNSKKFKQNINRIIIEID